MKVTRSSEKSNKIRTMELNVTKSQINSWLTGKGSIEEHFPNLTAEEREFIKTGNTPEDM